jgi:hypothetical protein
MIRKILMVAFATVLPVTAATAAAVVGGGVASAAKPPPGPITCAQTGTVTFQKPGLSSGGTLTTKASVKTKSSVTPTGTGCAGTPFKVSIVSATTPCPQTGGVPNGGDPAACLASKTNGKGVVTYAIAKKPNYYNTTGSFAGSGLTDLETALSTSGGLTTKDNGNKVVLAYNGPSSVSEVVGAACGGTTVGFDITGPVTLNGASTGLNYDDLVCLSSDSGTGTSGDFLTDLGSATAVIASATVGGNSNLAIS